MYGQLLQYKEWNGEALQMSVECYKGGYKQMRLPGWSQLGRERSSTQAGGAEWVGTRRTPSHSAQHERNLEHDNEGLRVCFQC